MDMLGECQFAILYYRTCAMHSQHSSSSSALDGSIRGMADEDSKLCTIRLGITLSFVALCSLSHNAGQAEIGTLLMVLGDAGLWYAKATGCSQACASCRPGPSHVRMNLDLD